MIGATYLGRGRTRFSVWAPFAKKISLHLVAPKDRTVPMTRDADGNHEIVMENVSPGARYFFRLDDRPERPDPASRFQPEGVHGPSEVVDPKFSWKDRSWKGISLEHYIFYELHVGTFTPEGTFDAVIPRLAALKDLGITAVEFLPVAQFPGTRNWGYDGVYPYAAQNSYGGPAGLKRLVDACHAEGLAAVLDVVYNHLGPEGNYVHEFAPYFSARHMTPWGPAVNFDGPDSDHVRRFFLDSARMWFEEFHFDAFRLDAIHGIIDTSAYPFLEELGVETLELAKKLKRKLWLIAESDFNDTRFIRPRDQGGIGLDAQWTDDFHHSLHTLLTGENTGYYRDFGRLADLAKAYQDGFVYDGRYSPYRRRRHGISSRDIEGRRLVVFDQNHDQAGNRARGDRLSTLVSKDDLRLAAAATLLSPYLPLLFMGEEYGETNPFLFFVDHGDPDLIDAVRRGRVEEFAAFRWQGEVPDPQSEDTFLRSRLQPQNGDAQLLAFYRETLAVRKKIPALRVLDKTNQKVICREKQKVLALLRGSGKKQVLLIFSFHKEPVRISLAVPKGKWKRALDSTEPRWGGNGLTIPAIFQSRGNLTLLLPPRSAAAYFRG